MQKVRTPLFEQLVINYSIFGFAHNIAMVAAIINAGGYGVYGAMRRFPDEIREELALIRLRRSSSINSQPTPLALPAQQHPTVPYPHFTERDSCCVGITDLDETRQIPMVCHVCLLNPQSAPPL
jgi:hypothetical protein